MPEIKITVGTVRDASTRIANCASMQRDVLNQVQKAVNDLKSGWEGMAKNAFEAEFNKAKPTYQKFADDIKEFSSFLSQYLADMEKGDQRGAQTMG